MKETDSDQLICDHKVAMTPFDGIKEPESNNSAGYVFGERFLNLPSPGLKRETHSGLGPKWGIMVVMILIFPLCSIHCAPVEQKGKMKDGQVYGITEGLFRAKWWNYYERGLSFASGRFWEDAETDLKEALHRREKDQRRARTYGMHFIDYFPHRELGVVLLKMGRIREAVDMLETSLSEEESAKAKFYLNRARKRLLLSGRGPKDKMPPDIVIETTADGKAGLSPRNRIDIHPPHSRVEIQIETQVQTETETQAQTAPPTSPRTQAQKPNRVILTNEPFIDLFVGLADDGYVSSYSINGAPGFLELGQKSLKIERRLPLISGSNTIMIEAEDLVGNRSCKVLDVLADHRGPQLSVIEYMNGQRVSRASIELTIAFFDGSGVQEVLVNGKGVNVHGKKNGTLSTIVALQPGENTIAVEAVDRAGNKTRGEIRLMYGADQAEEDRTNRLLVAWNDTFDADIATDANVISASAASGTSRGTDTSDSHPPSIAFRGLLGSMNAGQPLTMTGRKRDNRLLIEGQVSDAGGVQSVFINGEPIISSAMGKVVLFNRLVELGEGDNPFYIKAVDRSGNSMTKAVHVERRIQEIDMKESRISLSIMPFKNECISPTLAESVYNLFVDRVVNDERFNVVVRGDAFDAVLRELQLSQTDLVDNDKAVKAGRLMGSESIMFGKIMETAESVEVFVHLADTETSRILAAHDVYDQNKGRSDIELLMQGLSSKFTYSIPLLEGKVLASKGDKFFLDLGKSKHAKLQEGLKCIAYRSEPFIVDGMVLGEDITVLGTLLLKNVQEKISIASLVAGVGGEGIKEISKEDRVMTK